MIQQLDPYFIYDNMSTLFRCMYYFIRAKQNHSTCNRSFTDHIPYSGFQL